MKKILSFLLIFVSLSSYVFAEDITSTNFKINGASIDSGGQPTTSGTGDYKLLNTIGDFSADPRTTSTNYRASIGQVEIFTANVPGISAFETTTDGSSSCISGPSYLNSYGMTRVCGPTGCYDRARFEIDTKGNPSDTLYAIQISTDSFASDIKYIDGITLKPIPSSGVTIDDYLTKTDWETPTTNILGLESNTTYSVRAVALHGDFTESTPGPYLSATTALPTTSFDIDISTTAGVNDETATPYDVTFSDGDKIIQAGPTQSSAELIWIDSQTNGLGGLAILVKGKYGGLNSISTPYLLESATADLDSVSEGFGIQNYYASQLYQTGSGDGDLSAISILSPYSSSGNNVGIVDSVFAKIYESSGPTHSGRMAIMLKARASGSTPEASDYQEILTIVSIPKY